MQIDAEERSLIKRRESSRLNQKRRRDRKKIADKKLESQWASIADAKWASLLKGQKFENYRIPGKYKTYD